MFSEENRVLACIYKGFLMAHPAGLEPATF
jgi:hypothetical protein